MSWEPGSEPSSWKPALSISSLVSGTLWFVMLMVLWVVVAVGGTGCGAGRTPAGANHGPDSIAVRSEGGAGGAFCPATCPGELVPFPFHRRVVVAKVDGGVWLFVGGPSGKLLLAELLLAEAVCALRAAPSNPAIPVRARRGVWQAAGGKISMLEPKGLAGSRMIR